MRGSWKPNRTVIYWPPLLWPSALCLSRSPDSQTEARGPTLLGAGFLCRILSPMGLVSKTHWLPVFTELYNSSITHSISLEWHVWSLSSGNNCHAVHRSLSSGASVYDCTMGFYLVPYCQPSPPTRFLPITAIGRCHFRCPWNGMFGRVEGQYTTRCKRVRTPVVLLRSLSDKYHGERYEPSYPPSYGINSTTTVLLGEWHWH